MEQRDIEKFRKHMGLGKTMKIKNQDGTEDEFYFKPLGCQFLPDFMLLATLLDYSGSQKAELREMKAVSKNGKKLWLNITDILHLASEEILEHVGNFIEKEEK